MHSLVVIVVQQPCGLLGLYLSYRSPFKKKRVSAPEKRRNDKIFGESRVSTPPTSGPFNGTVENGVAS